LRGLLIRAQRFDEAVDLMREILSEDRKLMLQMDRMRQMMLDAYLFEHKRMLAAVLAQAGRFDEAVDFLNKQIDDIDQRLERARGVIGQWPDPRMRAQMNAQLQQEQQRQSTLLRSLAYIHQRQGRDDLAEQRMREAHKLVPADLGANNDLGYTLAEAGKDLDEAEKMIRRAVSEEPSQAAYMDSLGWVLFRKGQLQAAETWLLRATALETGEDPTIYDHLGDVQWHLRKSEQATQAWREAVRLMNKRLEMGDIEQDEKKLAHIQAKLDAFLAGRPPVVADIVASSQPATAPSTEPSPATTP
jgi:tetratricopeptide (TPR) repeat protein